MIEFSAKDYPFEFYCNACGELFHPTSKDMLTFSELPYPLMRLYHRFWGDNYGWLCYLVKRTTDNQFGLLLVWEYQTVDDDGVSLSCGEIAAKYQELKHEADALESEFNSISIGNYVYGGYQSGLDGCHELAVYIPSTFCDTVFQKTLYILSRETDNSTPPHTKQATSNVMERFSNSSCLNRTNKLPEGHECFVFEFAEVSAGKEGASIYIRAVFKKDDASDMGNILQDTCRHIIEAANAYGDCVDPDDLVCMTCDMVFGYDKWEPIQAAKRILF